MKLTISRLGDTILDTSAIQGQLVVQTSIVLPDAPKLAKKKRDFHFSRVFAISALIHLFMIVAAWITPATAGTLAPDFTRANAKFIEQLFKPVQEKKTAARKLELKEGRAGNPTAPPRETKSSRAPRTASEKRERDRQRALNSGLLGALRQNRSAVGNIFGAGGISDGIASALGGIQGPASGDQQGMGGLGARGNGPGRGGDAVGIGDIGGGGGREPGYAGVELKDRKRIQVATSTNFESGNGLDRKDIARVLSRNLARFKHCYEKELNANPNLEGKVAVEFTIAPSGAVARAGITDSALDNENVEACVVRVLQSLEFPEPKGGGVVVVRYPFVFAST